MSDPRIVEPQRAVVPDPACAHRYWCRTRITVVAILGLILVASGLGAWWVW